MSKYSFDVFLSYASKDHDFAVQLVTWLRACGFRIWVDEEQLVPGSRFRAGLQQGLRESRHMVAVLTHTYCHRPWTQRELDLFDLSAEHSDRRLLAVQLGELGDGPLDQVILVQQRIRWSTTSFDSVGFWKLYCGITGIRPGSRDEWEAKGLSLLHGGAKEHANQSAEQAGQARPIDRLHVLAAEYSFRIDLLGLVAACLDTDNESWDEPLGLLRRALHDAPTSRVFADLISMPWAVGAAEFACVVSLAMLPQRHPTYSIWPFLDLGCYDIADWLLVLTSCGGPSESEIWFSWAVSQQCWTDLPVAADAAPNGVLRTHFRYLALAAVDAARRFKEVEEEYDYGVMITPWNHFHLCWLASRLGDLAASLAYAKKLCAATALGDVRTGRFLNRLTTWNTFEAVRSHEGITSLLANTRKVLALSDAESIPRTRRRLVDLWLHAREGLASPPMQQTDSARR